MECKGFRGNCKNKSIYVNWGGRLTMVVVIWMMMLLVGVLRRWVT